MRRVAILLPLPLLAALALGGCGATSLTAAQLRSQASKICAQATARTTRIPMPRDPDHAARFLREGVAAMRPAVHALKRLDPPSDLRESYAQAVQLDAQAVALIASHERAIAHGEDTVTVFAALQAQLEPVTRIENATWQGLQISACEAR